MIVVSYGPRAQPEREPPIWRSFDGAGLRQLTRAELVIVRCCREHLVVSWCCLWLVPPPGRFIAGPFVPDATAHVPRRGSQPKPRPAR